MPIYDLNNIYFLQLDIDNTFNVIDSIYKTEFTKEQIIFYPKTFIGNRNHWASESAKEAFNNLVPTVKSLIKDMYSILENIFKGQTGKFEKLELEERYKSLKEFRLLNNKFKHFNDQQAEISLTELVAIEPNGNYIDVFCNFKYKDNFKALRLADFVEIYFNILEDNKIIEINRK